MGKTPQRKLEASARARMKANADPEKRAALQEYNRKYRAENKERLATMDKLYAAKHRPRHRVLRLKVNCPELVMQHVECHNGTCDICGSPGGGRWGELAIDHCHTTNNFRGMLCNHCNLGIGNFKDSPELLLKAIEYLGKEPPYVPG